MKITIPFKTPTINHLYWHRGNIKIMKKEAKELQKEIVGIVKSMLNTPFSSIPTLKVITKIYENWYNQDGTIKKKDVANREKFLIDSVFKGLEIDDKYIFESVLIKVQSDEEKAEIEICEKIENTK